MTLPTGNVTIIKSLRNAIKYVQKMSHLQDSCIRKCNIYDHFLITSTSFL
ncbi:hypothetical protein RLOC_00002158 [Lonchura striata]|uniref:Uncharacterized protein n=1 Tax=Lonchura striata TaxID=40157 RepID=A0A218VEU6_9PASE|nr:hypothetical protein RLOC_00002158 [Lonchura striata domestica]